MSVQRRMALYRDRTGPYATYQSIQYIYLYNLQLNSLFLHEPGCLPTESRWGIALRIKYPINFCIICNYIRCFRSSEDASLQTTDGPLRYVFYRWIHALQFVMQTNRVTHQTADMMPRAPGPVPEFAR